MVGTDLGEGRRSTNGGSQQAVTLYDVPTSAPVGRRNASYIFTNLAFSGGDSWMQTVNLDNNFRQ